MTARPPPDPITKRRLFLRAGGWAALAAGLFLGVNAAVVVFASGEVIREAPMLTCALLLFGVGVWLLNRANPSR